MLHKPFEFRHLTLLRLLLQVLAGLGSVTKAVAITARSCIGHIYHLVIPGNTYHNMRDLSTESTASLKSLMQFFSPIKSSIPSWLNSLREPLF